LKIVKGKLDGDSFEELEFMELVGELKKQKITITLRQQDEWADYFGEYKKDC